MDSGHLGHQLTVNQDRQSWGCKDGDPLLHACPIIEGTKSYIYLFGSPTTGGVHDRTSW